MSENNPSVDASSMTELAVMSGQLKELQRQKSEKEIDLTALNMMIDKLRLIEIPKLMETLGLRNATFEGIGRVQLAADLYCSTKPGQKDTAMVWLRDCGYADMISETYNATTMKALIRGFIAEGTEIPEFLNVTPFVRASVVKT